MSEPGFDFFIINIENRIMDALEAAVGVEAGGYVKSIASYAGELDASSLKQAIGELTPRLPMYLVAYGDGADVQDPRTAAVMGEPRIYRHDCTFSVFCISGDARGDKARRRGAGSSPGVYQMLADARRVLGGQKFQAPFEDRQVLLNPSPLKFSGVEYIARITNLTAYAAHFDTYIRFSETDRRQQGELVAELIFTVENTYEKGESNLPGVTAE
jgi:phage gp37-like protein